MGGVLSFDLRPGVSMREAEEIAEQLNAIVADVAYTMDA